VITVKAMEGIIDAHSEKEEAAGTTTRARLMINEMVMPRDACRR
jgi:hypothetical protein